MVYVHIGPPAWGCKQGKRKKVDPQTSEQKTHTYIPLDPKTHEKWKVSSPKQPLKIWRFLVPMVNICIYIYIPGDLVPETSFFLVVSVGWLQIITSTNGVFHSISHQNEVGFDCHFTASQREGGGQKFLLWVSKCVFLPSNEICDFMPFWSKN